MARIYARNLQVAKDTAKKIKEMRITKFHSQNALLQFVEEIKNPELKHWFFKQQNPKLCCYCPVNYMPSIKFLENEGIFQVEKYKNRYQYIVQKEDLDYFLSRI